MRIRLLFRKDARWMAPVKLYWPTAVWVVRSITVIGCSESVSTTARLSSWLTEMYRVRLGELVIREVKVATWVKVLLTTE